MHDVIIVGAGFSGLSAAYELQDRDLSILEAQSKAGGRVKTVNLNGVCVDMGAVLACRTDYLQFPVEAGDIIVEESPLGYFDGRELLTGKSPLSCLYKSKRLLPEVLDNINDFHKKKIDFKECSEKAKSVLNALFRVIHCGDIDDYSNERQHDAFETFNASHYPDGNQRISEAYLDKINIKPCYNHEVKEVFREDGNWSVKYEHQGKLRTLRSRSVVVATDAEIAPKLVRNFPEQLGRLLTSIKYGHFITVAIGVSPDKLAGFSYAVSDHWTMNTVYRQNFPGTDTSVLLNYICDTEARKLWQLGDNEIIKTVIRELLDSGVGSFTADEILFSRIERWKNGGTIIDASYIQRAKQIISSDIDDGLFFAGDYTIPQFPYGLDKAILSGKNTGKKVRQYLQGKSKDDKASTMDPLFIKSDLFLESLAEKVISVDTMICEPPRPKSAFKMGDLVPAGLVRHNLMFLKENPAIKPVINMLEQKLISGRQGSLWSFHSKDLVTSTDSALVLLGFHDRKGVEALEIFNDGKGRYVPQLWANEKRDGHMLHRPSLAHWCQPDYATTALIRYLQSSIGAPLKTSLRYLFNKFETRSGLYFANPWFVDWLVALAIADEESASNYRYKLVAEIIASRNSDGSFGSFDRELSTACALLALNSLEFASSDTDASGHWLQSRIKPLNDGPLHTTPFYSTVRLDVGNTTSRDVEIRMAFDPKHVIKVKNSFYGISYYYDPKNILTLTLALAALEEYRTSGRHKETIIGKSEPCHPRYRCKLHRDYIKEFALLPYI